MDKYFTLVHVRIRSREYNLLYVILYVQVKVKYKSKDLIKESLSLVGNLSEQRTPLH